MTYERPDNRPLPEFKAWPKIPRLNREVTVSEKIDGTNAAVWVSDDGTRVAAQSRTRWITPADDNAGFARWVEENREELLKLGPGHHYGEWWGQGIGRKYGLAEKRFSLFNTHRWTESRPACCHVVPVLWNGNYQDLHVGGVLFDLQVKGSAAVPGWMKPEGIVVFHHAADQYFKVLCEGDELPKGITTFKERETIAKLEGK
jgi:hypothetical protein